MNKLKRCRYGTMVYPPNDIYIGRSFELYGEFSEAEVAFFRQAVKPGFTVLDVGANIGAHTVPLAQLSGRGGRVLAFEPQRIPYYCLCGNMVLNNLGNVLCYQSGAAEVEGTISVPELNYDAESNFGGLDLTREYPGSGSYSVPAVRIDGLQLKNCHFMKIDVEGMERNVLEGAVETIRAHRPILYVEDDRQEKSAALRAFLDSLGYAMHLHLPPYFNPANLANNQQNVFGNTVSYNLFCYPKESAAPVDPAAFKMRKI
ncbi:MAG TPA: FkbM family methyltransferase [Gemmataceae bacterium]|jgi:FkbM family methyltransferase|nr:FkbM family methyltransferase [Gemmataceae bacterium]